VGEERNMKCSIADCEKEALPNKRLCKKHYEDYQFILRMNKANEFLRKAVDALIDNEDGECSK